MTEPEFIVANIRTHRAEILELNVEYFTWIFAEADNHFGVRCTEIVGMSVPEYVLSVIDKICDRVPPDGIFYLVKIDGRLAAMGGLRGLSTDVAEVKRIYVRPDFRGFRLGDRILTRLLGDARSFAYREARLDSGPFMKSAHRLYESKGFTDRGAYEGAEVPAVFHHQWRFMELRLISPA